MGLETERQLASTAASELEAATKQQVAAMEELHQSLRGGRDQLTSLVGEGKKSLAALQTLLTNMDLALVDGFKAVGDSTDDLKRRVKDRRTKVIAELDANETAINTLLPLVEEAARTVEATVGNAQKRFVALRTENDRLVGLAEEKARAAEERAAATLTSVQNQRQTLDQQANGLVEAWNELAGQLDLKVTELQTAFGTANSAAGTALKNLLNDFSLSAATTNAGVRKTLVETTAEELAQLSTDLGQHLDTLQDLGKRPQQLVSEDLTALTLRLGKISEILVTLEAVHTTAKNLELFDF